MLAGVAPLLSVPDNQKDWHPGSNNQVLNLVHPSLFPLVYGRTRVLTQGGRVELTDIFASCGTGEVAEIDETEVENSNSWSAKFQWLPCDVEFTDIKSNDEVTVRITSYINNLHPEKHQGLYRAIEKLISLSVPPWSDVVIYEGAFRSGLRIWICTYGAEYKPGFPEWIGHDPPSSFTDPKFVELMQKVREYVALPDHPDFEPSDHDEEQLSPAEEFAGFAQRLETARQSMDNSTVRNKMWDLRDIVDSKWRRMREVAHPEPGQSFTYEEWKNGVQTPVVAPRVSSLSHNPWSVGRDDHIDRIRMTLQKPKRLGPLGLQVIVKLASIELTPENPRYPGGSWHLEGMKNEHIVATSIYYYDVENTSDQSHIQFRQGAFLDEMQLDYEQDGHEPLELVLGVASLRNETAI